MGARFYAPELGVWTIGDPAAINSPNLTVSSEFAAANPYAYANLNPVIATDPDGNLPLWAGALIGAGVGAGLGAGIEAARQYLMDGKVHDWGRVKAAAAGGAVSGAITGLCPAAGVVAIVLVGAGSNAAGGFVERLVASGGKNVGTLGDVVIDAGVGGLTAGLLKGASKVIKRAPPVKPVVQKVQATVKSAASEWADVGDPLAGVMDRWSAEAACRSGGCKMPGGGRSMHAEAEAARDALASSLAGQKHAPATVVGAYSPSTGQVTAGASRGGGLGCAEGVCAEALGNPGDIHFTTAVRPRTGRPVSVCANCEATYGRKAFPDPATRFKTDE